ncbi:MAG: hypothetical protein ACRYF2_24205 [Janthinobacterium lividum]
MGHAIRGALFAIALCVAQPARAMDFRISGHVLYGTGEIVAGDSERLAGVLKESATSGSDDDYVLQLSSVGGDAVEAIRLGKVLRKEQVSTLVAHDAACFGSCALVFLGGTQSYATGVGIGRLLEFGGKLNFQGVIASEEPAVKGDGRARMNVVSIAALLDYAKELGGIDLGRVVQMATSQTAQLRGVTRPRDILALSINLRSFPSKTPVDWSMNACKTTVAKHLTALDDAESRVTGIPTDIPSVKALRLAVMSGRDDGQAVARALAVLEDSQALDLALGGAFYLDQRRPILDARSISLERGGGFYYDTCLAVRSKDMLAVILLDGVSHKGVFEDFGDDGAFLAMADAQTGLW